MALPPRAPEGPSEPTEEGSKARAVWGRTGHIKEGHGRPVYCVAFNTECHQHANLFATVGSNTATVYKTTHKGVVEPILSYIDKNNEEEYFVCKWTLDVASGDPILLVAGKGALMKVLNVRTKKVQQACLGHGDSVNDIAVHYKRPHLVVTASRDMSLRLWNLGTKVCVLKLAGEGGHRNEVLSVDFHPSDTSKLVSAGMDYSIKIWSFADFEHTVQESEEWTLGGDGLDFQMKQIHHPLFSTYKLHFNYVDCVRWYGDMVLSKSVDNKVLLWKPPTEDQDIIEGYADVKQEYKLNDANVWWIKFAVNAQTATLVGGNASGKVYVWNLKTHTSRPVATLTCNPPKSGGRAVTFYPVRQTAISWNGRIILASCDDGTLYRFDLRPPKSKGTPEGAPGGRAGALWPSGWSPALLEEAQRKIAERDAAATAAEAVVEPATGNAAANAAANDTVGGEKDVATTGAEQAGDAGKEKAKETTKGSAKGPAGNNKGKDAADKDGGADGKGAPAGVPPGASVGSAEPAKEAGAAPTKKRRLGWLFGS